MTTARGWVAVLLLAASCDGSCWKRKPTPFASEFMAPSLAAVIVTPGTASVPTGGSQPFTATGAMTDASSSLVTVTWSATGGGISTGGLYTAGGAPGIFRVIAVQQGGTLADTSTVTVSSTAGDEVVVSPAPEGGPGWLLLDSGAGGSCPSDYVVPFTGASVPIGNPAPACATELSLFASGHAPILDLGPAWTASKDVVPEGLPAAWNVLLHVVVEYPAGGAEAAMDAERASTLFDLNHMGSGFTIDGTVTSIDPGTDPLAAAIRGGCETAATQVALRRSDRLNVIYVREDQWKPEWQTANHYGYDCKFEGIPELIFIRQPHMLETLAHEIGHAFSLNHAGFGRNVIPGWSPANLMRGSIWNPGDDSNPVVDQFSLGQVYRANFHASSWLNTAGPRSGLVTKVCSDESVGPGLFSTTPPVTWPCPDLQLGWP